MLSLRRERVIVKHLSPPIGAFAQGEVGGGGFLRNRAKLGEVSQHNKNMQAKRDGR